MNALSDKRLDLDETSVHTCFDPLVEITHIVELLKLIHRHVFLRSILDDLSATLNASPRQPHLSGIGR